MVKESLLGVAEGLLGVAEGLLGGREGLLGGREGLLGGLKKVIAVIKLFAHFLQGLTKGLLHPLMPHPFDHGDCEYFVSLLCSTKGREKGVGMPKEGRGDRPGRLERTCWVKANRIEE